MLFHTANDNKRFKWKWQSSCKDSPRTKCSKQPQVLLNYYTARTLYRKMSSLCLPGPTSHDSEGLSDLSENSTPWSSYSNITWSAHTSLPPIAWTSTHPTSEAHTYSNTWAQSRLLAASGGCFCFCSVHSVRNVHTSIILLSGFKCFIGQSDLKCNKSLFQAFAEITEGSLATQMNRGSVFELCTAESGPLSSAIMRFKPGRKEQKFWP